MKESSVHTRIISRFSGKRILVIGDLMMDIYLKGVSTRLCPEAPVPVVDIEERTALLGGAANTVCNLKALGASVIFCSVTGNDQDGDEALGLLEALNIDHSNVVRKNDRRTITKTRVVSGSQVITRIDHGSQEPVDRITTSELFGKIEKAFPFCDAVVISDYDKGVITDELLEKLNFLQQKHRRFIAVDSKRLTFFSRLSPSYAKPNYEEVTKLLDLPQQSHSRYEQIAAHAEALFKKTGVPLISVTMDKEGCLIIENGAVACSFEAPTISKAFVSGAGDSFISAFVLSYITGKDYRVASEIATAAACIAVRKECTATCSQTELRSYFHIQSKWIQNLQDLREICETYHRDGKRIVFTNGCFDILHSGHVTYLHKARKLGDVLIVGLNTDESIKRIKGANRPINCLNDRLQVLAGLSSVDHIIPFGSEADDTPIPLIKTARPDIFVKGGDYTKDNLPEADTVETLGGQIIFIDQVPDHSTTRIINRINEYSALAQR